MLFMPTTLECDSLHMLVCARVMLHAQRYWSNIAGRRTSEIGDEEERAQSTAYLLQEVQEELLS